MENQQTASNIISIITFAFLWIPLILININIAKRKGKNSLLYGLISLLPFFTILITLYLISMTDKEIFEKLKMVEDKIKSINK